MSGTFSGGASYCGDLAGAIFLKGSSGNYDNLDIDCDGANNSAGACANDPSGQSETAFKDTVKTFGISDLDANIHPYVVFGNSGSSPSFNPQSSGMQPLSVMAVVCNNQVVSLDISFCSIKSQRLIQVASSMVSGAIPTVAHPLERLLSPWVSFASPTMALAVITATIPRTFYSSDSLALELCPARAAQIGRPRTPMTLRTVSKHWETSLLPASRLK